MISAIRAYSAKLRLVILLAVAAYLVLGLTRIGWADVMTALPTQPVFYAISLFIFALLPITETFAFRRLLPNDAGITIDIFVRKRVLNEGVLSYSGEAYLLERLMALSIARGRALTSIKDNAIVSALVSNTVTVILIVALLLAGHPETLTILYNAASGAAMPFLALTFATYVIVIVLYRRITQLSAADFLILAGLHSLKIFLVMGLQVTQWSIALPGEPAGTWVIFLTIYMLVRRLPFLPNADLVFLGLAISLAGVSAYGSDDLTAMLLAATATMQILHVAAFIVTRDNRLTAG